MKLKTSSNLFPQAYNNNSREDLIISVQLRQLILFSFLQVSIFCGRQPADYFPYQVAKTKILVAMAPKVIAAWSFAETRLKLDNPNIDNLLKYALKFDHYPKHFLKFVNPNVDNPRNMFP